MTNQSLHFRIERYDDEDGVYFVASGREIALVTEGDTLEETCVICVKQWNCIMRGMILLNCRASE